MTQAILYPMTTMATLAAMILYFWITYNVGKARVRFQIMPPRMDGPEEFQRTIRVQANTVEQLVLFLPLLWLAALHVSDAYAGALGSLWVLGRLIYALGYYSAATKRLRGFLINMCINALLFLGVLVSLFLKLGVGA